MDIQDVIQDMFTSKDFKEDDPLKEAVYSWFDKMPEPLLIRFVEGLRALRSRFGPAVSVGTAFSGSDVTLMALQRLEGFVNERWQVGLKFAHLESA